MLLQHYLEQYYFLSSLIIVNAQIGIVQYSYMLIMHTNVHVYIVSYIHNAYTGLALVTSYVAS